MKLKLTVAALALGGLFTLSGAASAAPTLQISLNDPVTQTNPNGASTKEIVGDPGGTNNPFPPAFLGNGAGSPTTDAGWPLAPSMAADLIYNPLGTSFGLTGWHAGQLLLTQAATVRFQYMGAGNSGFQNHFYFKYPNQNTWTELFRDSNGGPTTPCPVSGSVISCDLTSGGPLGQNQYDIALPAGSIDFYFENPELVRAINDGQNNPNSDRTGLPGYVLGVDPYLTNTQFDLSGSAVYAAFTDAPAGAGYDHDYQDMIVRFSVVPEPASLALLGMALGGLGLSRRRRTAD